MDFEQERLLKPQEGKSHEQNRLISLVATSAQQPAAQTSGDPTAVDPAAAQLPTPPATLWGVTACLLLADMLGIGCLSLPSVFARLGWLVSFVFLGFFSIGCGYLGVLFSRLGCAAPNAQAFDELGKAAMGKLGERLVYGLVYTTIFVDPIVLQLTCVLSLRRIAPSLGPAVAGAIVAALMIPLAQIQSIHDVGWLSIGATIAMALALVITLIKLLAMEGNRLGQTSLLPPTGTSFQMATVALMNLIFAFGGQVNWMRYESAMKRRGDFKYAVEVADLVMTFFYVLLAIIGYAKLGTDYDLTLPVTSVLARDAWVVLMNVSLFLRCLVAYIININVWTDMIVRVGKPWLGRLEQLHPRHGQKLMWGMVSLVGIAFSFVVAWLVPFFSTLLAIIASFGDVAAPYTLPALFSLALLKDISCWERNLLRAIVPISAAFALAGLWAAIAEMVSLFGKGESPI